MFQFLKFPYIFTLYQCKRNINVLRMKKRNRRTRHYLINNYRNKTRWIFNTYIFILEIIASDYGGDKLKVRKLIYIYIEHTRNAGGHVPPIFMTAMHQNILSFPFSDKNFSVQMPHRLRRRLIGIRNIYREEYCKIWRRLTSVKIEFR